MVGRKECGEERASRRANRREVVARAVMAKEVPVKKETSVAKDGGSKSAGHFRLTARACGASMGNLVILSTSKPA
jgi:hypothetical protein